MPREAYNPYSCKENNRKLKAFKEDPINRKIVYHTRNVKNIF